MHGNDEQPPANPSGLKALWRGDMPLRVAFWWYAMLIGTLVNILASFAFAAANDFGISTTVAFAVFLLPIPYNLFAAIAVWRSAGRYAGPPIRAHLARVVIILWALVSSFT